jgi:hypothetical protein
MNTRSDTTTCYYCKLNHSQVEAAGVWHCPNPVCTGPGAVGWRSKNLDSYEEVDGNSYRVDPKELIVKGIAAASEMEFEIFKAAVYSAALQLERCKEKA